MNLNPTGWASLVIMALAAIYLAHVDDPRMWNWIKAQWSNSVGAWFARRRSVIRVPRPDEHSRGIMVARRDINVGNWT